MRSVLFIYSGLRRASVCTVAVSHVRFLVYTLGPAEGLGVHRGCEPCVVSFLVRLFFPSRVVSISLRGGGVPKVVHGPSYVPPPR